MIEFCNLQINSCIFGILLLFLIALTAHFYPVNASLSRMDFLSMSALILQALLVIGKIETLKESAMIFIFHFLGMSMEIFKIKMGSWSYPLSGYLYIQGVPLFTGFMYASVGSYILRMQRNFNSLFFNFPTYRQIVFIGGLAYINFMTHHFTVDLRWVILIWSIVIFRKTRISLQISTVKITIPYLWVLLSISGLLWIAENIGSYYMIWKYPHQVEIWRLVSPHKIIAWYLLVLTALAIIYTLYRPLQRNLASRPLFTQC